MMFMLNPPVVANGWGYTFLKTEPDDFEPVVLRLRNASALSVMAQWRRELGALAYGNRKRCLVATGFVYRTKKEKLYPDSWFAFYRTKDGTVKIHEQIALMKCRISQNTVPRWEDPRRWWRNLKPYNRKKQSISPVSEWVTTVENIQDWCVEYDLLLNLIKTGNSTPKNVFEIGFYKARTLASQQRLFQLTPPVLIGGKGYSLARIGDMSLPKPIIVEMGGWSPICFLQHWLNEGNAILTGERERACLVYGVRKAPGGAFKPVSWWALYRVGDKITLQFQDVAIGDAEKMGRKPEEWWCNIPAVFSGKSIQENPVLHVTKDDFKRWLYEQCCVMLDQCRLIENDPDMRLAPFRSTERVYTRKIRAKRFTQLHQA